MSSCKESLLHDKTMHACILYERVPSLIGSAFPWPHLSCTSSVTSVYACGSIHVCCDHIADASNNVQHSVLCLHLERFSNLC